MALRFQKNDLNFFEIAGYALILLGLGILVWGIQQFNLFGRVEGRTPEELSVRFGNYGEFIGGIVGSFWALAGVLLFFATLLYQKKEFELQRSELHKTQRIFQQQHFSTLFISFLAQHNELVRNLLATDTDKTEWRGQDFFTFFKEKVLGSYIARVRSLPRDQRTETQLRRYFQDYFTYHFRFHESALNPYLRNFTVLLNLVERFQLEAPEESSYYTLIIRSSLSQPELFLLYHLTAFDLEPELSTVVPVFDLFRNLTEEDRHEYQVASQQTA